MCHYCTAVIYYDINNKTIENISYVFNVKSIENTKKPIVSVNIGFAFNYDLFF